VNTIIEIHDSTVAEIVCLDDVMVVHFLPAHLHKSEGRPGFDSGTCWTQEARLVVADAAVAGDISNLPRSVADGELVIGGRRHSNEIPVPLESAAITELRLVFDSKQTVTVIGRGARLDLVGEPRYVEEFGR
jgi:hypothetical protein